MYMPEAMKAALDLPETQRVEETTHDSSLGHAWRTVLFNCDCHSFDEVERQLIKAVRCTLSRARQLSNEVHTTGAAVVYNGFEPCLIAFVVTLWGHALDHGPEGPEVVSRELCPEHPGSHAHGSFVSRHPCTLDVWVAADSGTFCCGWPHTCLVTVR